MNKHSRLVLFVILVLLIVGGTYALFRYTSRQPSSPSSPPSPSTPSLPSEHTSSTTLDPRNATYTIDNLPVTLVNGKTHTTASGIQTSTSLIGEPTKGDVDGDGQDDAVVFLTQDLGGTGVFYYAAVALRTTTGTQGTNAVFLGDRIMPQTIEIKDKEIAVNYLDRLPSEPMTNTPSVKNRLLLTLEGMALKKIAEAPATISYLVSNADSTTFCNGADMDGEGYRKTITVEKTTSTPGTNPTTMDIIKATLHAATTGMCQTVMDKSALSVHNGMVSIPPIDAWAGVSIVMCSCKPLVEVNLLRIPGITDVVWQSSTTATNFRECAASGNQVTGVFPRQCRQAGKTFVEQVCTQEAKVCPDGTVVGRTGPGCEFAPCPRKP